MIIEEEDAMNNLCNAIIIRGTNDYANAIVNDDDYTKQECERFFRSAWFKQISPSEHVNGEDIMKRIADGAKEFKAQAIDTFDRGFVSKRTRNPRYRAFVCPICGHDVYSRRRVYKRRGRKILENEEHYIFINCEICNITISRPDDNYNESTTI